MKFSIIRNFIFLIILPLSIGNSFVVHARKNSQHTRTQNTTSQIKRTTCSIVEITSKCYLVKLNDYNMWGVVFPSLIVFAPKSVTLTIKITDESEKGLKTYFYNSNMFYQLTATFGMLSIQDELKASHNFTTLKEALTKPY